MASKQEPRYVARVTRNVPDGRFGYAGWVEDTHAPRLVLRTKQICPHAHRWEGAAIRCAEKMLKEVTDGV